MSASRVTCGVLCALALVVVAPVVSAEPTAAERETARTLLLSGRDKKKAGKLKEALADFERANGIMHVPTTALDLGKAQEALGLLVEARASYLEAARFPTTSDESRAFKKASQDAKQLADAIAPRLATLTVRAPAAAKIRIDDAEITASSIGVPLKVNPGHHEVTGALGADEKRQSADLGEGESKTVTLALAEPAATAEGPDEKDAPKPPPATEKKTSPLVWAGGAVAAVGVGVGAVTGIMSLGVRNDLVRTCTNGVQCPPSTYQDIDRGQQLGTISTVGFVVGGIGLAVMIYGLLTPREVPAAKTSTGLRVLPVPSGLFGTF